MRVPDATAPVTAFLPCRKGSQRVPKKNIRPFASFGFGLVEIKLRQLVDCNAIDRVILSTNDDEIIEFAHSLDASKLTVHRRAEELATSETSTDALVAHALELIGSGHLLWTHVTSPFITAEEYNKIIDAYRESLQSGHDSLMTTTLLHVFLWDESGPINYDRNVEKWPRTQTLKPLHEVNSGAFIAPAEVYRSLGDRIGDKPVLYPLDKFTAFDIDWQEDFVVAEQLLVKGLVST